MYGRHRESRKRSLSSVEVLNVCVVGGSIAGLAVAFTLASAGHRVTVFEMSDGKNNRCGAIKLPPNGTLCLNRWGLKTKVDKFSRKFMKCNFIRSESDCIVGTLLLNALLQHEAFLNQDVAEYTCITDMELWDWLYKLALDTGAKFKFNSRVVKVNSTRPSIMLESGEEIVADLVVGADSVHGITRTAVSGGGSGGGSGETSGNRFLTVSCTLPIDGFAADPELETLLNDSTLFIWAADDVQLKGQMNKGEKAYTIAFVYKLSRNDVLDPSIKDYIWYDHFKLEDFPFIDYTKFTGRSLKLLNMSKGVKAYVNLHTEVPSLDDLVSDSGKVVLIGCAAHGMPPGMQHNTSFGFEDAETLGYLFSRIPSRSLIPRFLMAYEEIRSSRIANASAIDVSLLQSSIMQEKLLQDRLDTLMAKSERQKTLSANGDHRNNDDEEVVGDDDELLALWSETLRMWLYDANEKVDDWWLKWGPGIVREYWDPEGEATAIYVDRNISHQ